MVMNGVACRAHLPRRLWDRVSTSDHQVTARGITFLLRASGCRTCWLRTEVPNEARDVGEEEERSEVGVRVAAPELVAAMVDRAHETRQPTRSFDDRRQSSAVDAVA
jgi:hypothetical protein